MAIPEIIIDLDLPAKTRWEPVRPYAPQVRELCESYLGELTDFGKYLKILKVFRMVYLGRERCAEIDALAKICDIPGDWMTAINVYYDGTKFFFSGHGPACSAFAIDHPNGPRHARNLDWWTTGNRLRDYTVIYDYRRGGHTRFKSVGWPGFTGILSGIAPGRFAVTLNAVLSEERGRMALPIVYLLREVLDSAPDFAAARKRLSEATIPGDCLLLLTGAKPGEMLVIERSPTRFAHRPPVDGRLVVTNSYQMLTSGSAAGVIGENSCGRFDTLSARLGTADDEALLWAHLDAVRMDITVQQMQFHAASGALDVRLPDGATGRSV